MFRKIIVGVDGLQGGRDAIALAQAVAPLAELVLVMAYPFDRTPSRFAMLGYGNALRDESEHQLRGIAVDARLEHAARRVVGDTNPARALHRVAEEEDADLIVVGGAHHGAVGRIVLGDVARAVLHGAPCPVAIAPLGVEHRAIRTIGVGYDGSEESRGALRCAVEAARLHDARLRVLEVVEPLSFSLVGGYAIDIDGLLREQRDVVQRELDEMIDGLEVEVEADGTAVVESPTTALERLADEVDLLVLGSRAFGPVRRVVLGSVADRLIHHTSVPVVVVPRGATVAAAVAGT